MLDPGRAFAAVICPLREEARSILDVAEDWDRIDDLGYRAIIRTGNIRFELVIVCPPDKGRIQAALSTMDALSRFRFDYVSICGICGAFPKLSGVDLIVGDVVFAEAVVSLNAGRIIESRYEDEYVPDVDIHLVDQGIISSFRLFLSESRRVKLEPISSKFRKVVRRPSIHISTVISSDALIRSEVFSKRTMRVSSSHKRFSALKPAAVEMEYYGVLSALQRFGMEDRLFMVRGVNDFANIDKSLDQIWSRRPAMNNASLVTLEFLKFLWQREQNS